MDIPECVARGKIRRVHLGERNEDLTSYTPKPSAVGSSSLNPKPFEELTSEYKSMFEGTGGLSAGRLLSAVIVKSCYSKTC